MDYDFPDIDMEDVHNYLKRHKVQRTIDMICEGLMVTLFITVMCSLAII